MNLLRCVFLFMLFLLPLRPVFASTMDGMAMVDSATLMTMDATHCHSHATAKSTASPASTPASLACAQHCAAPLAQRVDAPAATLLGQVLIAAKSPLPLGIILPPLLRPPLHA
jgi:hypothetical protein